MNQTRYYCTYFDSGYLTRGLALFHSLQIHSQSFMLWVLCFDDTVAEQIKAINHPQLRPIQLSDFERGDTALLQAKSNRSKLEYYFTCTPSLPRYLLNQHPEIDLITYLDADLYFFSSPESIFAEIGDASVAIVPHHFSKHLWFMARAGDYNVGWLTFRRDGDGLACLNWWRERCLEWCYDRVEGDKFGDQKYLNQFPLLFKKVCVIQHKGANLAPWNVENYKYTLDNQIQVDHAPLVFYHYQGLKPYRTTGDDVTYDLGLRGCLATLPPNIQAEIYGVYLKKLIELEQVWLKPEQRQAIHNRNVHRAIPFHLIWQFILYYALHALWSRKNLFLAPNKLYAAWFKKLGFKS